MKKLLKSKWLIILAIFFGLFLIKTAIASKKKPKKIELTEKITLARVLKLKKHSFTPKVESYGEVKSAKIWKVFAEVGGRVSYIHPDLKAGYILNKDETLFKLDVTKLELKKEESYAQKTAIASQIEQLYVETKNVELNLKLEKKQLVIESKELKRIDRLLKEDSTTDSALDKQKKLFITREQKIQALKNQLKIIPTQMKSLNAQLNVQNFRLKQIIYDISKAEVKLPFRARLGEVDLHLNSYVSAFKDLFLAHDVSKSEVHLQLSMRDMKLLINVKDSLIKQQAGSRKFFESLNLLAKITLASNENYHWSGKVTRIKESIDLSSRTIGLVVEVKNPYDKKKLFQQPPLLHGMFVKVELSSKTKKEGYLIPSLSIHNKNVFVVDKNNQLRRKAIEVIFEQKDWAFVRGFHKAEDLIISDIQPALDGMKINFKVDLKVQEKWSKRVEE
ncbi:MAG: hypothetical protein COB02_14980 [Candidatus Cloacimonadota bacterium]|nr:MAG: hypothetical protein COB02_14980 [Candidatus Cloacimonadota bacterium]